MTPREKWTDERLDDLNKKVDEGFSRLDKQFDRLDTDIRELHRTLVAGLFVLIAAIIGSNAALYVLLG